jgi:hypothetical protein
LDNDNQIAKYDRIRGALEGVALFCKQSTIRTITQLTGKSETFVVETGRHAEQGDYIFVECVDEEQKVTRLCLPPKVANAIASQRESLSAKRRSIAAKHNMKERMANGFVPNFTKKRKGH